MNLPRFQVRYLLILTTLLGVTTASLAPLLRSVDRGLWWLFEMNAGCTLAGGMLAVMAMGLRLSVATAPEAVHFVGRKVGDLGESKLAYYLVLLLFVFAIIVQWGIIVMSWGAPSPLGYVAFFFFWVVLGAGLVNAARWRVLDTQTWSIVDNGLACWRFLLPWSKLDSYRWKDPSEGLLEIDWGFKGRFCYQFSPDEVDAIEALLHQKLAGRPLRPFSP